ncbi:MAG: CotH kinase family protein [Lachnospiraceae bacterium]|nr:CotH kinase family protein [Lachnospiraceae bacterium]
MTKFSARAEGISPETYVISEIQFQVNDAVTVSPWVNPDGEAYVFLPSFADLSSTTISVADGCRAAIGQAPIRDGMSCSAYKLNQTYPFRMQGRKPMKLTFLQSENVPALFVNTGEGEMNRVHADKEYKADAEVSLYTADGELDYASAEGDRISGRGNSTWKLDKKPYNLRLNKKAELLGMRPAKKWSLLANAYDETNLRNKIILDFAREIAPYEGFAPECEFVDVYANGEYLGLYLMCRSVDDVTKDFLDKDSEDAYEIELTMAGKVGEDELAVPVNEAMAVEISVPSPCSEEQLEQLTALVEDWNRWISSDEQEPDGGTKSEDSEEAAGLKPDFDSLAKKLLIEIVFENYDGANASQYFWGSLKDRTVYAGPCWDYDLSMGIYYINWSTPHAMMAFKDWNLGQDISWYHGLWQKNAVRERALEIYENEFRSRLSGLIDERIPAEAEAIASAGELDRARWAGSYTKYESAEQAVDEMTAFLQERVRFLDSLWLDQDEYHVITMKLPNTRMLHIYALDGEACEEIPLPCEVSLEGEGMEDITTWYIEGTDEVFDPGTVIEEDLVLYARYPEEGR